MTSFLNTPITRTSYTLLRKWSFKIKTVFIFVEKHIIGLCPLSYWIGSNLYGNVTHLRFPRDNFSNDFFYLNKKAIWMKSPQVKGETMQLIFCPFFLLKTYWKIAAAGLTHKNTIRTVFSNTRTSTLSLVTPLFKHKPVQ